MSRRVVLFTVLAFASTFVSPVLSAQTPVSLRADYWCPFNCLPGGERPGLLIEIAERAFGEEQLDYQLMNWARAVEATRVGDFEAIVGAFSGDAPDFVFPEQPLAHTRNCFYVDQVDWTFRGMQSLQRVRLGVSNAYDYGRQMATYIATHQQHLERIVIATGSHPTGRNLELLGHGRIDALIESEDVMGYLIAERGIEGLRQAGCLEERSPMYIAFSPLNPRSPELVGRLNETVRQLNASGEMLELRRRYGLGAHSPPLP